MEKIKYFFNCIKDYYSTIIDLYQSCDSDYLFIENYQLKFYDIKYIYCNDKSKMKINSIDDLLLVFKAKYCLELPIIAFTVFDNAHYIAGDISQNILLGNFNYKTLSSKQKEMFIKSIYVDFSNIDIFDLRKISDINFIKDKNKKFYS